MREILNKGQMHLEQDWQRLWKVVWLSVLLGRILCGFPVKRFLHRHFFTIYAHRHSKCSISNVNNELLELGNNVCSLIFMNNKMLKKKKKKDNQSRLFFPDISPYSHTRVRPALRTSARGPPWSAPAFRCV